MEYKLNEVFFYEELKNIEALKNEVIKLKSEKKSVLTILLFTLIFIGTTASAGIYNNAGISEYLFAITGLSSILSTFEFKYFLDINKEIKINKNEENILKKELEEKKRNLNKKINIYEKKDNKTIEKTINISQNIESISLKNKLLLLREYIIYKEKYDFYYINNVLDAHLKNKHTSEEIEFIKQIISENIQYVTEENEKNKTKIK